MRTPAGKECRYFYGDYFRGKTHEECRLIGAMPPPDNWTPDLCLACPVPGFLLANDCQNLTLKGKIVRPFGILKRKMKITAFCTKSHKNVLHPEVGCGMCHPLPTIFEDKTK
jgi:hypothetical protein